jgi:hypothetical protein
MIAETRFLVLFLLAVVQTVSLQQVFSEVKPGSISKEKARKVALFVVNREIDIPIAQVKTLEDLIASRVANQQFQVLTRDVVLNSVSRSLKQPRIADETLEALKEINTFLLTESGKALPTRSLEEELSKQTSAMRLAQSLGANMILVVTIQSYGHEKRVFKGNAIAPVATTTHFHNLRVSYHLGFSADGASVAGDQIKVTRAWRESEALRLETDDLLDDMLEETAKELSKRIFVSSSKIKSVPKPEGVTVAFKITPALPGGATLQLPIYEEGELKTEVKTTVAADVAVDGISIGTGSDSMQIAKGLHQISVQAEGYKTWKRFVNISDGQRIQVNLEMTQQGYERWKEVIVFFEEISKRKKMTSAEMELLSAKAEALRDAGLIVNLDKRGLEIFKTD